MVKEKYSYSVIQGIERSERLVALAKSINEFCGANMSDEVRLHDLYYVSDADNPIYECNPPIEWLMFMKSKSFPVEQRAMVSTIIGKFYRYLSKNELILDPTLGDLRNIDPEKFSNLRKFGPNAVKFVQIAFM